MAARVASGILLLAATAIASDPLCDNDGTCATGGDEDETILLALKQDAKGTSDSRTRVNEETVLRLMKQEVSSGSGSGGLCMDNSSGLSYSCDQLKNYCNESNDLHDWIKIYCPITCGVCQEEGAWLPCYPHACGAGRPWPKQGNTVSIPYFYGPGLDDEAKAQFLEATKSWESAVCSLKFVYSDTGPGVQVDRSKKWQCSSGVGFNGPEEVVKMEIDGCPRKGNILKLLGYVVGFQEEHRRPDAFDQIQTPAGVKGPYLTLNSESVPAGWRHMLKPLNRSYIGSQTAGYAPYDFDSIMQAAPTDIFNFSVAPGIDPAMQLVMGQRSRLSAGDIAKFNDMYQVQC